MNKYILLLIVPFLSFGQTEKIKKQKKIIQIDIPNGWSEMIVNNDLEESIKENINELDKELGAAIDELPLKEQVLFYYRQSKNNLETILPEIKCLLIPSDFKI